MRLDIQVLAAVVVIFSLARTTTCQTWQFPYFKKCVVGDTWLDEGHAIGNANVLSKFLKMVRGISGVTCDAGSPPHQNDYQCIRDASKE